MILNALLDVLNRTTRVIEPDQALSLTTDYRLVDFYAVIVAVDTAAAAAHRDALLDQVLAWPGGHRGPEAGMSLNDARPVLGSAGNVYRLFALGDVLAIWRAVLPTGFAPAMDSAQAARLVRHGALAVADFDPRRTRPR